MPSAAAAATAAPIRYQRICTAVGLLLLLLLLLVPEILLLWLHPVLRLQAMLSQHSVACTKGHTITAVQSPQATAHCGSNFLTSLLRALVQTLAPTTLCGFCAIQFPASQARHSKTERLTGDVNTGAFSNASQLLFHLRALR